MKFFKNNKINYVSGGELMQLLQAGAPALSSLVKGSEDVAKTRTGVETGFNQITGSALNTLLPGAGTAVDTLRKLTEKQRDIQCIPDPNSPTGETCVDVTEGGKAVLSNLFDPGRAVKGLGEGIGDVFSGNIGEGAKKIGDVLTLGAFNFSKADEDKLAELQRLESLRQQNQARLAGRQQNLSMLAQNINQRKTMSNPFGVFQFGGTVESDATRVNIPIAKDQGINPFKLAKSFEQAVQFRKQHGVDTENIPFFRQQALNSLIRGLTGKEEQHNPSLFDFQSYQLSESPYIKQQAKEILKGYTQPDNQELFIKLKEGGKKWLQEASKSMKEHGTVGKFSEYCGGKVTNDCIEKGLKSPNETIRKRAQFAKNVRGFAKKDCGGKFHFKTGGKLDRPNDTNAYTINVYGEEGSNTDYCRRVLSGKQKPKFAWTKQVCKSEKKTYGMI